MAAMANERAATRTVTTSDATATELEHAAPESPKAPALKIVVAALTAIAAGGLATAAAWRAASASSTLLAPAAGSGTAELQSVKENTFVQLLRKLEICGSCKNLTRFGEENDGGYLTCMDGLKAGKVPAAYSMGVESHDQWSADFARAFAARVNQYDCTVYSAPAGCSNCTFYEKCIKAADGFGDNFPGQSWDLAQVLSTSGMANAPDRSLVMKMDIEGSEWPVFAAETDPSNLMKFQQMIVEFHWLEKQTDHVRYARALDNILNAGFRIVHLHGNNFDTMFRSGGFAVPNVLEATFVAGAEPRACLSDLELLAQDSPNLPSAPEIQHVVLP